MKRVLIPILAVIMIGCAPKIFRTAWLAERAPENYVTRFETSKGTFEVSIQRKLSPKAADRFYQLVKHGYFTDGLFYRVNPDFVAQFGSTDKTLSKKWGSNSVPDEPVLQGNSKGAISFARGGKDSRTTDVFINLGNNKRLDTIHYNGVTGFPSFGKVSNGMEVLESLFDGYADSTMNDYDLMQQDKKAFLTKFPKLDAIRSVHILN